ncbi:Uridine kinase [Dirofilaria immitis]
MVMEVEPGEADLAPVKVSTYEGSTSRFFIIFIIIMNVAEKLQLSKRSSELKGVIVKLEKYWLTISVISPMVEVDSFEVKLENVTSSKTLKLGSWVVLHIDGQNVYRIVRQCDEILPTYIYKDFVLLRTNICFQQKEQEGYGQWVWSPVLGRIAAVCHEKYKPKQTYIAFVARKPTKYQLIIEYNWMLTKYIEELNLNSQLDVIFQEYRICSGRKSYFNKEYGVHYNEDNYCGSVMDYKHLFFDPVEKQPKIQNSVNTNVYATITKVISNPNIRIAMQNYRPKELLSICEALDLKFYTSEFTKIYSLTKFLLLI